MNQLYFKNLFSLFLVGLLPGILLGQHQLTASQKHGDRYDLVANISKLQLDNHRIDHIKNLISISKDEKNKKQVKIHRDKLTLEKKILKDDYQFAKDEECTYKENKSERISQLEGELKASSEHYESIRAKIKKDLARKNDFTLRKDADDLLKAVQDRNEASTQLSMEKAEMLSTVNAMDEAWRKVKQDKTEPAEKSGKVPADSNLTKK